MSHKNQLKPPLLGVVLCGGRSSRMGQDKSRLPHREHGTFLNHALDRLSKLCRETSVAGAADQQTADGANDGSARFLMDDVEYQGPITGIVNALAYAQEVPDIEACLVTAVDLPNLSVADLGQLVMAWQADRQLTCAISESTQKVQPLIAIYPTECLSDLQSLAESEDRSLYRWIEKQTHQTVSLNEKSCHNVNAPDDLIS